MTSDLPEREELYLLRVQDKTLADRLRGLLRQPAVPSRPEGCSIELLFSTQKGADPEARTGKLVVEGESYTVRRQDLPTIVECFKTYDDVNLVKSADVGQIILVPEKEHPLPEGIEARNGITPPMKDARKRRFRKLRDVDPAFMQQVEDAVLLIASGLAPEGYEFIDEEEEYVVSADGRSGSWQPFQPGRFNPTAEQKPAKRKYKKRSAAPEAQPSQEDGDAIDVEDI